jgi:hypothetical protein
MGFICGNDEPSFSQNLWKTEGNTSFEQAYLAENMVFVTSLHKQCASIPDYSGIEFRRGSP